MLLACVGLLIAAARQPHPRLIADVEISYDDKWLAVSDATDDVWIYRASDGKLEKTLHHKAGSHLVDIEISPDDKQILCTSSGWDGDYTPVWSTKTWKETAKLGIAITKTFWDSPNGLEYGGGGRYAIGPTFLDHQLVVWDTKTGQVAYIARKNAHFGSFGIAVNPMTTLVAVHEPEVGKIRFWDFENPASLKKWGSFVTGIYNRDVRILRFSHDGNRLFVLNRPTATECVLYICKPVSGETAVDKSDEIDNFDPRDMSWSDDDSMIYIAGLEGHIACFDPSTARVEKHWIGHNGGPIKAVAAFHHDRRFVTGGGDTVCVWSGADGKLLRTIRLPAS